jgi:hypothetical protein
MKLADKLTLFVLVLGFFASPASAQIVELRLVAYALGWIMMVFMGIKWIVSDSANDRADAKKGMIYIVIGLLVVRSAKALIDLYCDTARISVPTLVCTYPAGL